MRAAPAVKRAWYDPVAQGPVVYFENGHAVPWITREHGEYRTKRVVLETWDALASAAEEGVPYESPLGPPRRAAWSSRT